MSGTFGKFLQRLVSMVSPSKPYGTLESNKEDSLRDLRCDVLSHMWTTADGTRIFIKEMSDYDLLTLLHQIRANKIIYEEHAREYEALKKTQYEQMRQELDNRAATWA